MGVQMKQCQYEYVRVYASDSVRFTLVLDRNSAQGAAEEIEVDLERRICRPDLGFRRRSSTLDRCAMLKPGQNRQVAVSHDNNYLLDLYKYSYKVVRMTCLLPVDNQIAKGRIELARDPVIALARVAFHLAAYPKAGESIHGFTLKEIKHVPELHLTALQLEHDKTGAEYLHVARDDKNNVFAINFKTNPIDRTGLPHILEHVTLCGSEKYPVRDPFFKMMPRSLANFMNAFTSSDYTSYPFATTNLQDFRNLSSVYLDATLHPLLKHSDFLQEGWRLGPEDPREPATEDNVKFKGVVYNEMKGQMSDASYLFYIRFREHLFPSLHNSGGDPEIMTQLTHKQLVDFSRKRYHPSNAKIFSYGSLPLAEHLQHVDDSLSKFDKAAPDSDIKQPISFVDGPLSFEVSGPIDTMQPPDQQSKSSISWMGCPSSDIVETFSVSIMMSLLMSGYGSPLYQGLVESGLGTNFSPNSGYDSSAAIGILSVGLDGMKTDDVPGLKATIRTILREKAHEAFQPHKIEGYMHQLELALKHKTANFGMGLMEKTLSGWFNGVNPMDGLAWNQVIDAFKQRTKEERYLERLVERYLLNDNSMQFTMRPDESYGATLDSQEEKRRKDILKTIKESASSPEAAITRLGEQELGLLEEQESAQQKNLDTLPTLRVSDIALEKERKPRYHAKVGDVDVLWRETETNGITYFQAKHLFKDFPDDLRLLMPLFTDSLMRLGTTTMSVGDLEAEILLKTGGISISSFAAPEPSSLDNYHEGILVDGYALDRNVPAMFDLIRTLLLEIDFSGPKAVAAVRELLESKASGALDSVAESGHHFAVTSAAAALTKRGRIQDQLSGLSQIELTTRILDAARRDPGSLEQVIQKLQTIQSIAVANSSDLSLRVVCEPNSVKTNRSLIENFLAHLPQGHLPVKHSITSNAVSGSSLSRRAFFNMPFQVSYTGTCLQTAPYTSPDKAPLTVLGQLLVHNFLHPEVREKGGAYGASASASPISALFTMSSYRDPNPRNSLNVFNRAGTYARDKDWTARELEESKLSIFQGIDAPRSVSGEASKEFLYGITEAMDQEMRERLLGVTKDDVQRVAQRYLVDLPSDLKSVCVLGEKKGWIDQDQDQWQLKSLKMSAES
ncbi:Mitochondrial presequence protease [Cladophialophora chaetospira]|uniref:Presequence protease, mitochondrial n=1 Tax=Cladophialophora chaetospira TaxID=386627 RepID=A0AA38X3P8_9EURO|nr:Mitochondrial presequence protease [Cladophialophora chaetospira]